MSSFFRKVASAFVQIEEPAPGQQEPSEQTGGAPALEEMIKGAGLLSQLESTPSEPADDLTEANPSVEGSLMALTAEDVFRQHRLGDGSNSALRLLKLVNGLSMFPREQQLIMVRAMDVADDSWAELEVASDARARQQVLRAHLQNLAGERAQRQSELTAASETARKNGDAVLAELDRRIAELQVRRGQEAATTETELARLAQQQKELEARELRARQGIAQVIQALAGLLTFLGASQGPEQS